MNKTLEPNKAIIMQTIALILTMLGLAIAAEHRITTIEMKTGSMLEAVAQLQTVTATLNNSQIRVVTLLDMIDKRHAVEDQRRTVSAKK